MAIAAVSGLCWLVGRGLRELLLSLVTGGDSGSSPLILHMVFKAVGLCRTATYCIHSCQIMIWC
ncbi:hypothetical protein EJ110_NYTH24287 [Nymphaea thermarum]|nr:hypothetical protein EJ110_NYTH24287 [Nymphaea thermarum]